MALEQESEYFEAHRQELLERCEGQFALIHRDCLLGSYASFDEAFNAGIQSVGNQPFLIKQVLRDEPPQQLPALVLGLISAHVS